MLRPVRRALLSLACALSSACASRPPTVQLPTPFEQDGVRVEVESILGAAQRYQGVVGEAYNVAPERVEDCVVTVEALTSLGEVIARGQTRTGPIEPGQGVRWEARFPLAGDVHHVPRPRLQVFRASSR